MSINVNVCSRCIDKRSEGLSRASEAMWDACLQQVKQAQSGLIEEADGIIFVYDCNDQSRLLMSNENGFDIDDELLKSVILNRFSSRRMKPTSSA